MDAKQIQHLTTEHDSNSHRDHSESAPTEEIIKSCVLEIAYKAAIIDAGTAFQP
jgi:hypothetical protein